METFKTILKRSLEGLGLECRRTRPLGADPLKDIKKIYGQRPVRVVFDVGANEGQAAMEFTRSFSDATIYSFEPFAPTFELLKQRVKLKTSIVPVNIALGSSHGRQTMYLTEYSCTNSLLPVSDQANRFLGDLMKPTGEVTTETKTLDHYCSEAKVEQIDLLKLDVQGYELKVLEGATNMLRDQKVAFILTELNFVSLYEGQAFFHQVYERLQTHGFQLVSLYNENFRSDPVLGWCDGLFVNLDALKR
jgi:FkbM family methyltransferase